MADLQSMDTRRRAIEALNDFLGDIKRRAINPTSYYDVGHRLQGNSLPLPVGNGYNTGYSSGAGGNTYGGMSAASLLDSFNSGDHMGGGGGGGGAGGMHVAHGGYSLPLPNARTKNDLQDIDRFLEQLQATVYETSTQAAAAGVQQPGVHVSYTGDYGLSNQQRSSNSPPGFNNYNTGSASTFGAMSNSGNNMPNATAIDTPALTPASVASSYTSSGHSPMSNHSRSSLGSLSGGNMYPSLPSVTGMSDLGSGYPTTTSAPASSLASGFDGLDGRRYSGGRLQRQAPTQEDTEMADVDAEDGSRTPRPSDATPMKGKVNNSIDPALRGEEANSSASTPAARSEADDKREEGWVENMRTIEALRMWISKRLEKGEYEEESEESKDGVDSTAAKIAQLAEKMAASDAEERAAREKEDQKGLPRMSSILYYRQKHRPDGSSCFGKVGRIRLLRREEHEQHD